MREKKELVKHFRDKAFLRSVFEQCAQEIVKVRFDTGVVVTRLLHYMREELFAVGI